MTEEIFLVGSIYPEDQDMIEDILKTSLVARKAREWGLRVQQKV